MKFIGALFSVSIFSLALIHHETNELSIFKANLKNRAAKKKNKASHLKQLQRSKPDSWYTTIKRNYSTLFSYYLAQVLKLKTLKAELSVLVSIQATIYLPKMLDYSFKDAGSVEL